jgi:hypothetical protein
MHSTDQGAPWSRLKNLGKLIVSLTLDPNNPNNL